MRVSDAEREAATAELQEHFASGRLNQDELNDRLAAAFAAKTRGDLDALFSDLPSSGRGWAGAGAPGGDRASRSGSGSGSSGAGTQGWGPWAQAGASDGNAGWQGRGGAWRASAGRSLGRVAMASVLIWVLFIVGILGVFGIGTGRPFGIVLIVAAFALLRRLVFIFFGRGRGRGGRGCGRRRGHGRF
ncbi:MAG: DUF1707 SHOCT-like domain-containing protein [Trebonia sp.]